MATVVGPIPKWAWMGAAPERFTSGTGTFRQKVGETMKLVNGSSRRARDQVE